MNLREFKKQYPVCPRCQKEWDIIKAIKVPVMYHAKCQTHDYLQRDCMFAVFGVALGKAVLSLPTQWGKLSWNNEECILESSIEKASPRRLSGNWLDWKVQKLPLFPFDITMERLKLFLIFS